jgi:hypothetical protein
MHVTIGLTHSTLGRFAWIMPKVYRDVVTTIAGLQGHYANLRRAFPGSAWAACSINMGPWSISDDHIDSGNAPGVPCAITALGKFDPTKGGHLVLFDLKLIIQFPPGSTILIPSASLRHGNIRVHDSETRYSVIQYMAGGLACHLAWGFKIQSQLSKKAIRSDAAAGPGRWLEVLSRFSTPETLDADRRAAGLV